MVKLRDLLEMLFDVSAISDDRKEIFMTVFMSEDESQMVEVLLEFSEEYSDRSSWIEFVKKIEEITKTDSRLLKDGIQSCETHSLTSLSITTPHDTRVKLRIFRKFRTIWILI